MASSLYTLARIYEHLYIDKVIIERKLSLVKISFLFFIASVCVNSSVYIFIISLLIKMNFYMGTVALVSVVVLFTLTIHYIENQLLYQQNQLENKNEILTINEQHYRSLFDNHPDAVFTIDLKGNFVAVNSSVPPMIGLTIDELQQFALTDLVIEEEKSKLKLILEEVYNGRNSNFETTMKTKTQELVNLDVTALPIIVNREITGAYFIAQDITKQLEIQEQVKFLAYHDELTGLFTAEGVENEEQLTALNKWSCDEIQGFYYSKPLPEEKLIEYWQVTAHGL